MVSRINGALRRALMKARRPIWKRTIIFYSIQISLGRSPVAIPKHFDTKLRRTIMHVVSVMQKKSTRTATPPLPPPRLHHRRHSRRHRHALHTARTADRRRTPDRCEPRSTTTLACTIRHFETRSASSIPSIVAPPRPSPLRPPGPLVPPCYEGPA